MDLVTPRMCVGMETVTPRMCVGITAPTTTTTTVVSRRARDTVAAKNAIERSRARHRSIARRGFFLYLVSSREERLRATCDGDDGWGARARRDRAIEFARARTDAIDEDDEFDFDAIDDDG